MQQMQLIYFSDPMCSWCYGFSATLARLADSHYADRISMELVPGGLRPDETRPTPQTLASEIQHHWRMVQKASGQPFHFGFFEGHPGFVYNTTPASRAVVAAGLQAGQLEAPDHKTALAFQHALQRAFYAQGADPTSEDTFLKIAEEVGLNSEEFESRLKDPATDEKTRDGFARAFDLGIMGYPTLLARDEERLVLITRGFVAFDELEQRLAQLAQHLESSSGVREK
ncbi:MAG: DsbA family protein [Spirochaetales bacterium]|nr:DsbA family protein [Spirochaetales bacterium]MCP5484639.1 DsbA family protein [Spirochaetales bacterium]